MSQLVPARASSCPAPPVALGRGPCRLRLLHGRLGSPRRPAACVPAAALKASALQKASICFAQRMDYLVVLPGSKARAHTTWVTKHACRCLQVVFVTTEIAPWSKTGGLGDVLAALPAALAAR